jgi:hypothetical protein
VALQDVSGAGGFDSKQKATEMELGQSITGYLIEINEREGDNGTMHSLIFNVGGKSLLFYPAGNIKYMIQDGKLKTGVLTRVTRTENKTVGKGKFKKESSQFKVEQDVNDVIKAA